MDMETSYLVAFIKKSISYYKIISVPQNYKLPHVVSTNTQQIIHPIIQYEVHERRNQTRSNQQNNQQNTQIPTPVIDAECDTEAKPMILVCVICSVNCINTVLIPCMHSCLCCTCAKEFTAHSKDCPICRISILEINRIYLYRQ